MSGYMNVNQQEVLFYPKCEKTFALRQKIQDIKTAIIYLKLRHVGCKKREAINFCQKTICKVDTTKIKDGPANCRKLKPSLIKGLQLNGWELTSKRDYDMGLKYRQFNQLGIDPGHEEAKITQIIESKIQNNTHDYLYRIKVLDDYIKDIEKKCKLPKQDISLLSQKIDEIVKEIRDFQSQPIYHMNYKGVNLYEIFQEYQGDQKEQYNNSYINLFDSFSHIYNKQDSIVLFFIYRSTIIQFNKKYLFGSNKQQYSEQFIFKYL